MDSIYFDYDCRERLASYLTSAEGVPVFVGLDYHSQSVQVCVVDAGGTILVNRKCGNGVAEIDAGMGPGRVVQRAEIESCRGAAKVASARRTWRTG